MGPRQHRVVLILSVLVALLIDILPLSGMWVWLRPPITLLVLLDWLLVFPGNYSIAGIWIVGILQDLLHGNLLGQHALSYVIIAYLLIKLRTRFLMFSRLQQLLIIMFLVFLDVILQRWIMSLAGQLINSNAIWWPVVTTLIAWPVIQFLMAKWRRSPIPNALS